MSSPIKVLVVDDSGFMRVAIRKMLEIDPQIEVIGEANNGYIALQLIKQLNPDIITMDIEMPEMDGLQATKEIMAQCPRPIIILSSLAKKDAPQTIRALETGAVDFISKSSSFVQLDIVKIERELREKIHYWGKRKGIRASSFEFTNLPNKRLKPLLKPDLITIAVSTGGPKILPDFLCAMGKLSCPVVIAQHMPASFTENFALQLRETTQLNVVEGREGMPLENGLVVIAKGGVDTLIMKNLNGMALRIRSFEESNIHPWAEKLFESAEKTARSAVAVILTGMGTDGSNAAQLFIKKGWPVLVQEPSTCVVDGMPGAAIEQGAYSEILTPEAIGKRLQRWAGVTSI